MSVCSKCGKKVPEASPRGLCPICCLVGLGMGDPLGDLKEGAVPGVELGEVLGVGSFGEVYEGVEAEAGFRRVAVKVLRKDGMGGAQRARFLEEAQILATLEHVNIARLLRSGRTSDGRPYYVMEFVDGATLGEWAKGRSLREKIGMIRQVAEAVTHAHQKGVAHRDLKPGNVLVDGDGVVKVIDFGIARAFEGPASWGREVTMREERMGTPLYMSPEQLAGGSGVDLRADVWAMGLLLYEVVLSRPVLDEVVSAGGAWSEMASRLERFIFPRLGDRELGWIGRKACSWQAEDRYQTGAAFLADLRAWEKGEVVSVGLGYTGYRVGKWMKRHPFLLLMMTAGILLFGVLGVAGWWVSAKEKEKVREVTEAREFAEKAERETRREASDTALLAGVQAMNSGDFYEARERLDEALQRWPENREARFALDYLETTMPSAKLVKREKVNFLPKSVEVDPEGMFLVEDQAGERHAVGLRDWAGWKEGRYYEGLEFGMGRMEFLLKKTGEEVMAPMLYGAGRASAAFSDRYGLVLIARNKGELEWWDVSAMGSGLEVLDMDSPVTWMEFVRKKPDLWLATEKGTKKWDDDGNLGWYVRGPSIWTGISKWNGGEAISKGLPENDGGWKSYLHLLVWKLRDSSRRVVATAVAREAEVVLLMGNDGVLAREKKGGAFQEIEGMRGVGRLLAVDSRGKVAVVVTEDDQCLIVDVTKDRVEGEMEIGKGVTSVVIPDGGREAVMACQDGFVRVWNLEKKELVKEISVAVGAVRNGGFYLRSLPRRREFLCLLEGDFVIRRFSLETGLQMGRGFRHEHGVWWFFTLQDEDIVFSVDQKEDGSTNGVMRVWSLRLGRELIPGLKHDSPILWMTVLRGGRWIATSTMDGRVRRWVVRRKEGASAGE